MEPKVLAMMFGVASESCRMAMEEENRRRAQQGIPPMSVLQSMEFGRQWARVAFSPAALPVPVVVGTDYEWTPDDDYERLHDSAESLRSRGLDVLVGVSPLMDRL